MDPEEYLNLQQRIILLANLVKAWPLREFIDTAEKADTVGPILDPTLWIKAHDSLSTILDLARSLRNFQDLILIKKSLGTLR